MTEREQFEAWCKTQYEWKNWYYKGDKGDNAMAIEFAFKAWKAARSPASMR
jgi:hypothetical protein